MSIMSYIVGLGLAAGAGGRAAMVVLGLGVFHHTEYFELADPYLWIASPPVMAVLVVIALVEIAADMSPDVSELADLAGYLPSFIGGFIALSAATGQVDENLLRLALSGILGGMTGTGVRWLRNRFAALVRDASDATSDKVHSTRSVGETFTTAGIVTASFLWPMVAVTLVAGAIAVGSWVSRALLRRQPT